MIIEVSGLVFAYEGKAPVFDGFDWRVERGEAWAVIGPSGCGKTTLLYLLTGLRQPLSGRVLVDGKPLVKPRRATGLILQDYGLLPWATAAENVMLGLRIRGMPTEERRQAAATWLARVGLTEVAHHYPSQLSGGQRQRVAIARTLALKPDLLLMDEPFSSLDTLTREELEALVMDLARGTDMTTVLVTHNIEEAVFLGRRILVVSRPPIRSALVVENARAGSPGYRGDPAFYAMCGQVRGHVQERGKGAGG
ncbi:MAG: ATP-binding cassette domain-containing protein [Dehalococcoidia bacterium]|nr:ATP-binding cassette domain-containing protein [Dehalococcoidia bacterium]